MSYCLSCNIFDYKQICTNHFQLYIMWSHFVQACLNSLDKYSTLSYAVHLVSCKKKKNIYFIVVFIYLETLLFNDRGEGLSRDFNPIKM